MKKLTFLALKLYFRISSFEKGRLNENYYWQDVDGEAGRGVL